MTTEMPVSPLADDDVMHTRSRGNPEQQYDHHLKAIIENTNMPVFLKDSRCRYLFVNPEFERLLGLKNEQIQGKDDYAIFPEEIAELFRLQDNEVLEKKCLVEFEETIFLGNEEHTFITSKFPLIGADGKLYALGGVCADITARKQAQNALQVAEEKYRNIFDYSPLGILQIDQEGIITASNEKLAEILDTTVERVIGFDILQSIRDKQVKTATLSALSGQTAHYEGRYLSISGKQKIYLRGLFSPIFAADGSIHAAIGIVEDITKQKQVEKELRRTHGELEQRVEERTEELKKKTNRLNEINIALKVLLEQRQEDKQNLEKSIRQKIEKLIYPYLEKLQMTQSKSSRTALLRIIKEHLEEISAPLENEKLNKLSVLTPTQLQIADLIKHGHTTKEIADLLGVSPATIACHRQEIRKRLSLTNKRINLQTALTTST